MIAVAAFGNLMITEDCSNGRLFVFNCNYAVDKLNISNFFYYELLLWWSELRDLVDCDGEYKYVWIYENRVKTKSSVFFFFVYF